MAYVSILDVEAFTGFGAEDMKQGSLTMTASQWEDYCTNDLIPRVEQLVNRYCGVASFDEHTVIEYRNSPGDVEYLDNYMSWMTPGGPGITTLEKTEYILTEPCIDVSSVAIKDNMWIDSWENLVQVSSVQGDWYFVTMDELTHVYVGNLPPAGNANIRFTYTAGFPAGSVQFREIQLIVLRIIRINLEEKLKFQQAGTIRNVGVRDYVEMYDINKTPHKDTYYIPEDICRELNKYRRLLISQGI
jgi:hypothetical protein